MIGNGKTLPILHLSSSSFKSFMLLTTAFVYVIIFCTYLLSQRIYWVFHSLQRIIVYILSFMQLIVMWRTRSPIRSFFKAGLMMDSMSLTFSFQLNSRKGNAYSQVPTVSALSSNTLHSMSIVNPIVVDHSVVFNFQVPWVAACIASKVSLDIWHRRLAHAFLPAVKKTLKQCDISFSDNRTDILLCSACEMGNSHTLLLMLLLLWLFILPLLC